MKFLLGFLLLTVSFLYCSADARIRYINTLPQFGSANVTAVHNPWQSPTHLFNNVLPNTATTYSHISNTEWNFYTSFDRKVIAGSSRYDLDGGSWYTIYTYQKAAQQVANFVIEDNKHPVAGNFGAIRAVNLALYNYSIDVTATNSSNSTVLTFEDIPYAAATNYALVPPGDYVLDWDSEDYGKRNIQQTNCTFCGVEVKKGKRYTYYVLPTVYLVVLDASTSTSRSVRSKRLIQKKTALVDRLEADNTGKVNKLETDTNKDVPQEVTEEVVEEEGQK